MKVVADWRWFVLAAYAGSLLFVGSHHEAWFDEAQAWLLARDSGLWQLLGERVRYEGTPGLWHTTLWVLMRAGLPYSHLFLVPAGFAVAGAAVILWRSPFPAALKGLLLASYFFGYQFAVVARSYCMFLLLIPLAAVLFRSRVERPLRYALIVGLIANVSTHGFVAAAVLGLELTWRLWRAGSLLRSRALGAVLIAGALGLFALWCAWQPHDNSFLQPETRPPALVLAITYLSNAFVNRLTVWDDAPFGMAEFILVQSISALVLPVSLRMLHPGNRVLGAGIFGALITLSALVYSNLWHAGVLFLFWFFLIWIEWDRLNTDTARRCVAIMLAAVCTLQAAQTLRAALWDVRHAYSSGRQAAEAVAAFRAQNPSARIYAHNFRAFELQPWLPANPFANYHHGAPDPSYIVWKRSEPWPAATDVHRWKQLLAEKPDLIVASEVNLRGGRHELLPTACMMGYRIRQTFTAAMTWRGIVIEDATLFLYERSPIRPQCAGDVAR